MQNSFRGDFDVTLDPALDCSGGNPTLKESVKLLKDVMMESDLVDIWRIRNPDSKKFTWKQKRGIMVDGNELKLVVFADDMTSFVRDKQSHLALFNTIKLFSAYSGLCINHYKTEILLLGNMEMKSSDNV